MVIAIVVLSILLLGCMIYIFALDRIYKNTLDEVRRIYGQSVKEIDKHYETSVDKLRKTYTKNRS